MSGSRPRQASSAASGTRPPSEARAKARARNALVASSYPITISDDSSDSSDLDLRRGFGSDSDSDHQGTAVDRAIRLAKVPAYPNPNPTPSRAGAVADAAAASRSIPFASSAAGAPAASAPLPTPSSSADQRATPNQNSFVVSDSDSDSSDIAVLSPTRTTTAFAPGAADTNPLRRRQPPKPPSPTTIIDISDLPSDDISHDPAAFPLKVRMPRPDDLSTSYPRPSSAASNASQRPMRNSHPTQLFEIGSDSDLDDLMHVFDTPPHGLPPPPPAPRTPPPLPRSSSTSSQSVRGAARTTPPITISDGADADDDDIRILSPAHGLDPVVAACGDVLIMFPDIDPTFLKQFVSDLANPESDPAELAAVAVNALLERKEAYPKISKELLGGAAGGKRKRIASGSDSDEDDDEDEDDQESDKLHLGSDDDVIDMSPNAKKRRKVARDRRRGKGPDLRQHQLNLQLTDAYRSSCLHVLQSEFPTVPMSYVQTVLARHHGQYVMCHEALKEASAANPPPFKPIRARRVCAHTRCSMDQVLKEHVEWLVDTKKHEQQVILAAKQAEQELEQAKQSGLALECGCCFDTYLPRDLASCLDGHLFCLECLSGALSSAVGDRKAKLTCMSMDVCEFGFARAELVRACKKENPKLLKAWDRLLAETAVRGAEIDGLVLCPYCDYGAVTVEGQTVFACEACGSESCVRCRKAPHVPLTCDEAEKRRSEDGKLSLKHRVEEEMTNALVRNCPKCGVPSFKTEGCNKMTCTCGQKMCYVCRKPISDYSHFDQSARSNVVGKDGKCPLWDDTAQRNHAEVDEAEKRALEALKKEQADIDPEDLNIGGVAGRAPPPPPARGQGAFGAARGFMFGVAGQPAQPQPAPVPARINLDEHMARIRELAMQRAEAPAAGAAPPARINMQEHMARMRAMYMQPLGAVPPAPAPAPVPPQWMQAQGVQGGAAGGGGGAAARFAFGGFGARRQLPAQHLPAQQQVHPPPPVPAPQAQLLQHQAAQAPEPPARRKFRRK